MGSPGGPRAVFLHGITSYGGNGADLATRFLADHEVLAPDLLGHGASPYEPPWDIAAQVDSLIHTVGDRPGLWIGHSFGARLAFEVAARRPELVTALVLLDPALRINAAAALAVGELIRRDVSFASIDEAVERRFVESFLLRARREVVERWARGHLVQGDDGRWRYRLCIPAIIATYGEMTSEPPPFASVRTPTLLVLGRESKLPYDHMLDEHIAAAGELLTVVTVPGGHAVLWDALEETGEAVATFARRALKATVI